MTQQAFEEAVKLMDAANSEDPNIETADGKEWPKELLYSHRMSEMLERYKPESDDVAKLAIRGQHIMRWKSPRRNAGPSASRWNPWSAPSPSCRPSSVMPAPRPSARSSQAPGQAKPCATSV